MSLLQTVTISVNFSLQSLSFSPGHSLVHKPVFSEGVERPAEKNITNCFFLTVETGLVE